MPQPIYILHVSADGPLANKVTSHLQSEDILSISASATAPREQSADAWSIMLLILSQGANDSEEILEQVTTAIAANKVLIPFRVENFRPTGEMQDHLRWRYVHEAFSPPLEKHLEELVRMIKPLLQGRSAKFSEATSISRTLPSREAVLRRPPRPEAGSGSGDPVLVSLNFPHLVLASHPTMMQCRVENIGSEALTHLKLLVECRGLKHEIVRATSNLPAGGRETLALEIEPGGFGQFSLRFNLQWQQKDILSSYCGVHFLRIHEAPIPGDFPSVLQFFSQGLQSTTPSQRDHLTLPSSIASADELSRFKLPDRFEPLDLALDYEVGSSSVQRANVNQPLTLPPEFLDQAQTGTVLQLTPIDAPTGDPHQDIRLVARPQFVLGRSGEESDFILWFWPRNEVHDTKTRRISKKHVTLAIEDNRLVAINTAAGSLTTYEGQDVTVAGIDLSRQGILSLSGIYLIDILYIPGPRQSPQITNFADWRGHTLGASAVSRRGCVRLSPRTAHVLPQNSIWLLSDATFGASKMNPVALESPGLADIQGRFRFDYGVFWLESLADNSAVQVNDRILTCGMIVPLSTGQQLKLGTTNYSVSISA